MKTTDIPLSPEIFGLANKTGDLDFAWRWISTRNTSIGHGKATENVARTIIERENNRHTIKPKDR